jgi:hypothetical protein
MTPTMRISPHQESYLSVAIKREMGTWRSPALWGYEPSAMDHAKAIVVENWSAFRNGRSLPGLGGVGVGKLCTNFSNEIRP